MKKSIVRLTVVGILTLGLTVPAIASAGWFNWGCRYQGTWFGVVAEEVPGLFSGWMMTIEGKSFFYGTNNVEFTAVALDPRLPKPGTNPVEYLFPLAVQSTTNRGNWIRTGYNTLAWTMTGFGLDANGRPLYLATGSGEVTLSDDCNGAVITTASALVYPVVYDDLDRPWIPNPFIDPNPFIEPNPPMLPQPIPVLFPEIYAYRVFVDLP